MARGGSRAFEPGEIQTPFARVPLRLLARARGMGMPNKWAVLVALFTWCRKDGDGSALVSCSRSEVARLLGMSAEQVRNAVEALKRDGIIQVAESGHRGRASVYRVRIGSDLEADPIANRAGLEADPNVIGSDPEADPMDASGTDASERACPRNMPYGPIGSDLEADPIRNLKKVSYSDPSSGGGRAPHGPAAPEWKEQPILRPVELKPGDTLMDMFGGDGR